MGLLCGELRSCVPLLPNCDRKKLSRNQRWPPFDFVPKMPDQGPPCYLTGWACAHSIPHPAKFKDPGYVRYTESHISGSSGASMKLIRRNLSLLALFLLPGLRAADTPQIGFVLEMNGEWRVNGTRIKGPGQGLPPEAVINLPTPLNIRTGEELRITIVLLNNKSIPRTCHSAASCEHAQVTLPKSLIPESPFSERLSAARMRLFSRDPERYVPGLARSGDSKSAKLKDRVLLLEDDRLLIGDWFQAVAPANYSLVLVDFNREGATRSPAVIPVAWTGDRGATMTVSNLAPGLYGARLMLAGRSAINQKAIGEDAWVLVSAPGTYNKDSADYGSCVATTSGWEASPKGIQTFARVCMDTIAAPPKDPVR